MKKVFFVFFTLLISNFSFGQFSPMYSQAAEELRPSVLEIVLTNDRTFDESLKLVVSDELEAYRYDFITKEEFAKEHQEGDRIFALLLSKGEFDLPTIPGLSMRANDQPFYGIVNEYHQNANDYQPGYNIVAYTLNIPGEGELDVESALRLFIRNINNEVRATGEDFLATMKERQDWAQEHTLFIPSWAFDSSLADLKKAYPYPIKVVPAKRIAQAIKNNEEVILCLPFLIKTSDTSSMMYFNYFFAKDGTIIDMFNVSYLVKKDEDKTKAMKAKAEQKALRVYAKNIR